MSKTIAVIPGDGIGPEIMTATLRVLDALDCGLTYDFVDAGMVALEKHGDLLPQSTLDAIAKHKVALKGPLTTPIGGGFTSINVTLRRHFDLYANVRPAISFPGTKARFENIDIITVRENTEGAYLSEGQTLSEDGETADLDDPQHPQGQQPHRALCLRAGGEEGPQEGHGGAQGEHHQDQPRACSSTWRARSPRNTRRSSSTR